MTELTKVNPVLMKKGMKELFKEQILANCPRKRPCCKAEIEKNSKTVKDELEICAECCTRYLLNQAKI